MSVFDAVPGVTLTVEDMAAAVTVPRQRRGFDVVNPPYSPVPATAHIANGPHNDVTTDTVNTECPKCSLVADHPVKYYGRFEVEAVCAEELCGAAMHVEVFD